MKVWWVLSYDQYYPSSGLGNVDSTWATKEEAEARAKDVRNYVEVENVSEMLGLDTND